MCEKLHLKWKEFLVKKKELDDDKTLRDEIDNLVTLQDALFQLVKSPAKTFSPNVSESEIEKTKLVYTIGPNTIMKKKKRKMKGFDKKENTILTRRKIPFCFKLNNLKILKSLRRKWIT